jgi:hypothetical protein
MTATASELNAATDAARTEQAAAIATEANTTTTAPKPTKVAKIAAPSQRAFKRALGMALIANAAKFAQAYRMQKDCPIEPQEDRRPGPDLVCVRARPVPGGRPGPVRQLRRSPQQVRVTISRSASRQLRGARSDG